MRPGNNESAGKRLAGTTAKGNRWLRATLGEVAWPASRTRHRHLSARYRRLIARRGKNRAIVAGRPSNPDHCDLLTVPTVDVTIENGRYLKGALHGKESTRRAAQ